MTISRTRVAALPLLLLVVATTGCIHDVTSPSVQRPRSLVAWCAEMDGFVSEVEKVDAMSDPTLGDLADLFDAGAARMREAARVAPEDIVEEAVEAADWYDELAWRFAEERPSAEEVAAALNSGQDVGEGVLGMPPSPLLDESGPLVNRLYDCP